jgi:uncharacterized protein YkwD
MQRHPGRVDAIERALYDAVGDARQRHDSGSLTVSGELEAVAADYAETVSFAGERGHRVDGTTPQERADGFAGVRENLAYSKLYGHDPTRTAESIVDGWLGSEHRKNLLHTDPRLHGIGLRLSGDRLVVCHLFARERKVNLRDRVRGAVDGLFG